MNQFKWIMATGFIIVTLLYALEMRENKELVLKNLEHTHRIQTSETELAAAKAALEASLQTNASIVVNGQIPSEGILPFQSWDIGMISLSKGEPREEIPIIGLDEATRKDILISSVHLLGESARVKVDPLTFTGEPIYITYYYEKSNDLKEYPYYPDQNIIVVENVAYYASDSLLGLMAHLFKPESAIADLMGGNGNFTGAVPLIKNVQYELSASFNRFAVNGLDYNGWEGKLADLNVSQVTYFYDRLTDDLGRITEYEDGMYSLPRAISFSDQAYQTEDGVRVGMTKKEVLQRLGEPAVYMGQDRWNYQVGDYNRFTLLFDGDRLTYILLLMPL